MGRCESEWRLHSPSIRRTPSRRVWRSKPRLVRWVWTSVCPASLADCMRCSISMLRSTKRKPPAVPMRCVASACFASSTVAQCTSHTANASPLSVLNATSCPLRSWFKPSLSTAKMGLGKHNKRWSFAFWKERGTMSTRPTSVLEFWHAPESWGPSWGTSRPVRFQN